MVLQCDAAYGPTFYPMASGRIWLRARLQCVLHAVLHTVWQTVRQTSGRRDPHRSHTIHLPLYLPVHRYYVRRRLAPISLGAAAGRHLPRPSLPNRPTNRRAHRASPLPRAHPHLHPLPVGAARSPCAAAALAAAHPAPAFHRLALQFTFCDPDPPPNAHPRVALTASPLDPAAALHTMSDKPAITEPCWVSAAILKVIPAHPALLVYETKGRCFI